MNKDFESWRQQWEGAKGECGNIRKVVDLWKQKPPQGWGRNEWKIIQGYRSSGKTIRGEQSIERQLLGVSGGINIHSIIRKRQRLPFVAMNHRFPLANQRLAQVIADAFGIVLLGSEVHPVVVEVKVSANDCWSAMVQNLLQIRMLRHCHQLLKREFAMDFKGVWGIVLAPIEYFQKDSTKLKACGRAMDKLKSSTEARIAFCASDELSKHQIQYVDGNWR